MPRKYTPWCRKCKAGTKASGDGETAAEFRVIYADYSWIRGWCYTIQCENCRWRWDIEGIPGESIMHLPGYKKAMTEYNVRKG